MKTVNTLENLKHKEKTVDNLIEYITNRVDENSNYCLFLGSGASVNSNIKSGEQLVEEWREQIFFQERPDEKYDKNEAKKYFKQEHSSWYDENREYSSLFERKYNLATQRRKFVELAVENAIPSFGYHYLAKLIQKNYFNAVFTTNFDDLIEQAIDSHKSKRPIVCAQDSSVKSISVTSKRPKIIKLHGDFLFDDIQTTITETYSLKDNMYDKFLEFAKNFGFIFVGYSGTDKSIIDTLNTLLKREDYLNDGIYWCIRKQDIENINENVRKLLWRDKVYYVLIDGFDELMAQLYNKIIQKYNQNETPYDTDINKTVISHNNYLNAQKEIFKDSYICNDIEKCKNDIRKKTQEIKSELDEYTKNENSEDGFSFFEEGDIENKIRNHKYTEAIAIINEIKEKYTNNSNVFNKIMKLLAECYVKLKKKQEAIDIYQQLICYNDENKQNDNVSIYLKMSMIRALREEKISDIEKAIGIDENNPSLYNIIGKLKTYYYPSNYTKEEILRHYNHSIDCDASYYNPSYFDSLHFTEETNKDYSEIIKCCDDIISSITNIKQDKYSKILFEATLKKEFYLQKKEKIEKNEKYKLEPFRKIFNEFLDKNKIYQRNVFYIKEYVGICSKISELNELKAIFAKYDIKYKSNVSYRLKKAQCLLRKFRDLDLAIKELESISAKDINCSKESTRKHYYEKLALFYFYNAQYNEAYKKIKENFDLSDSSDDLEYARSLYADILFYVDKNEHLKFVEKQFNASEKLVEDYTFYTFNLLKHEKYVEVYNIIKDCYKNNKYNSDKILNINYLLAKRMAYSKAISEDKVAEILKEKEEDLAKVAAHILRDKHDEAKSELKKLFIKNYEYFYEIQNMPLFNIFNFNYKDIQMERISLY